ncbi:MAG: CDP-glycerol glycerophosphotransferase family protein [Clostridia bacterium]|nr:CDP-glycerol glycerophosphotransferase family protein [Clostridia bacterium]
MRLLTKIRNAAALGVKTGLYCVLRVLPLRDRVMFQCFHGWNYGDNTRAILEELHRRSPQTELLWLKDPQRDYALPPYVRAVNAQSPLARTAAVCTSRVVVNTHRFEREVRKRKGQLFIETWHGGLGVKKVENDMPNASVPEWMAGEIRNTCRLADLFLSNSRHLTGIYRRAFGYSGLVWRCGYPKNDVLHRGKDAARAAVRAHYGLPEDAKLLLYAPTFRDTIWKGRDDAWLFDIGEAEVLRALRKRFGGAWYLLKRLHPVMQGRAAQTAAQAGVLDATAYPDMQELILGSDAFLSDYSSGIFDAAEAGLPCFSYVPDAEEYAAERGVYYTPEELPFPFAKTRAELAERIEAFDETAYAASRDAFFERTGLVQTDHAAADVVRLILGRLNGETKLPEEIRNDD